MENKFAVVAAGIELRVVRLQISVYPGNVSKAAQLAHMGIGPPKTRNPHIMVPDRGRHVFLGLVHILDHIVALADETEIAA